MAFPFDIFDEMDQMMGSMFGHPQRRRPRPAGGPMQQMIGFPGMPQMPGMMQQMMPMMPPMMPMMPPMMSSMMGGMPGMGMSVMASAPGSTMSFSSTSISYNGGGRPNVVQASQNVRVGPSGVREEQATYQNSRTGEQRMRVGRHINQRGHVMEQARNRFTGQRNEEVEYIGIQEEEVQDFNEEFNSRMERAGGRRIQPNLAIQNGANNGGRGQQPQQPRITQGVEIIELSDEEDNGRNSGGGGGGQQYSGNGYSHHSNDIVSEPRVDFPDAEQQSSAAGQRRQMDNDRSSPNSSTSDDSSSGRRRRNPLHNLGKTFKSKKPRK